MGRSIGNRHAAASQWFVPLFWQCCETGEARIEHRWDGPATRAAESWCCWPGELGAGCWELRGCWNLLFHN